MFDDDDDIFNSQHQTQPDEVDAASWLLVAVLVIVVLAVLRVVFK